MPSSHIFCLCSKGMQASTRKAQRLPCVCVSVILIVSKTTSKIPQVEPPYLLVQRHLVQGISESKLETGKRFKRMGSRKNYQYYDIYYDTQQNGDKHFCTCVYYAKTETTFLRDDPETCDEKENYTSSSLLFSIV